MLLLMLLMLLMSLGLLNSTTYCSDGWSMAWVLIVTCCQQVIAGMGRDVRNDDLACEGASGPLLSRLIVC